MRLISVRTWLLVLLSALLQICIFPIAGPLPYWRAGLAWIALVPLLLAILGEDKFRKPLGIKPAFLAGYLCGLLVYAGTCYWTYQTMYLYGGLPRPVSFAILILFALYLGLYHGLFAVLLAISRNSRLGVRGTLMLSPAVWVAVELARGRITGFPWDLLGNSQIDNSVLTHLAPVTGVMGMSFVIVAVNAGIAAWFLLPGPQRWRTPAASLVTALLLHLAGVSTPATYPATHTAVLMQENLAVGATGRDVIPLSPDQEMATFSAMSLHPELTTSAPPELIVWPEAPSHFQSDNSGFRVGLEQLATAANAPVIAGGIGIDLDQSAPRGYLAYDSAALIAANGTYSGRYDKIHLVPWGEYVPFKQLFSFAQKLTEGVGDMDPGRERTVFRTSGHTYGVFICYESIFGTEVREFAKNGAQVLVNISDDGWYGDTGAPWQHLNMARMRAIENHRWLLRSTNTGITTAIDPAGRTATPAPRHVRGAYTFAFGYFTDLTFYTRFGDWFAWLCAACTLLALTQSRKAKTVLQDGPTARVAVTS